jgi:outer membrane murein-binding lipoprotein Lpp
MYLYLGFAFLSLAVAAAIALAYVIGREAVAPQVNEIVELNQWIDQLNADRKNIAEEAKFWAEEFNALAKEVFGVPNGTERKQLFVPTVTLSKVDAFDIYKWNSVVV